MRALIVASLAALALALGGCGDGATDEPKAAVGAPLPTQAGCSAGYPSTIAHAFGVAEITRRPERVVTLGVNDQDPVLAFGVKPIAVGDWGSGEPHATGPWSRMLLGDAKPALLEVRDGIDFDAVAELEPDLIVAINAGLSRADYERLAAIAPTLGPDQGSTDGFSSNWSSAASAVAPALGCMDQGDALELDTRKRFAAVAAAHPEFRARVATLIDGAAPRDRVGARPSYGRSGRGAALSMLGFRPNPRLTRPDELPVGRVAVPSAELDTLDSDVAVVATRTPDDLARLKRVSGFDELGVVKEGRTVYADPLLADALLFPSPLSLRYVLDHLPPLLEQAVDGAAPPKPQGGSGT